MKRILKISLAFFISISGIVAFYIGYQLLQRLGLLGAFAAFIFPGCIFFMLAGLLSMVLPFFTFQKVQILSLIALQEGTAIVFILADELLSFHKLSSVETLAAVIGLYLIVTSVLMLLWDSRKRFSGY